MPSADAVIETPQARRYMVQLCKHWSHKFPDTAWDDGTGRVPFAFDRRVAFDADDRRLAIRVEAATEAEVVRMEGVVIDHLKRFAFREDLGTVAWSDVAAS